jgi:hypothetical protein
MNALGTLAVNINPLQPVKQCGFIQQTQPISAVHDDLMLRLLRIDTPQGRLIHAVYDNIGLSLIQAKAVREAVKALFSDPTEVVLSCTHTHFGGDPHDETYFNQLKATTLEAITALKPHPVNDLRVSFLSVPFTGVGQSRISNHRANVVLDVLCFYDGKRRLATQIIHNCHPTILSGLTPFFTAEYPGVTVRELERHFPNESFQFLQGADGDISTRFTRQAQTYEEVTRLGLNLAREVQRVLASPVETHPLIFSSTSRFMPLVHELKDLDALKTNPNPSPRELETIAIGRKVLENLKPRFHELPKSVELTAVHYGPYTQVYAPNELFSDYLKVIPKERASLVCYSQGYAPYVSGLEELPLTYELFTDTYSVETKTLLYQTLAEMAQGD